MVEAPHARTGEPAMQSRGSTIAGGQAQPKRRSHLDDLASSLTMSVVVVVVVSNIEPIVHAATTCSSSSHREVWGRARSKAGTPPSTRTDLAGGLSSSVIGSRSEGQVSTGSLVRARAYGLPAPPERELRLRGDHPTKRGAAAQHYPPSSSHPPHYTTIPSLHRRLACSPARPLPLDHPRPSKQPSPPQSHFSSAAL